MHTQANAHIHARSLAPQCVHFVNVWHNVLSSSAFFLHTKFVTAIIYLYGNGFSVCLVLVCIVGLQGPAVPKKKKLAKCI